VEIIEHRYYVQVPAFGAVQSDYVVPDGKTLTLFELGANGVPALNAQAVVTLDPAGVNKILLATAGDTTQRSQYQLIGDGVKAVRITLNNNSAQALTFGAYLLGELT
jgi:hypothetical protein